MSKIGKEPVKFDSSKVEVKTESGGRYNNISVIVKGTKGELQMSIRPGIEIDVEDGVVNVKRTDDSKQSKSYHGLYRSIIGNMVKGVTDGYEKKLEIHGVGYRGSQKGNGIELSLGFSHKIDYEAPEGIELKMADENTIVVTGVDKQKVGQVAAEIRALRKPEPYKGKGIRYEGEHVRRKAGKSSIATE